MILPLPPFSQSKFFGIECIYHTEPELVTSRGIQVAKYTVHLSFHYAFEGGRHPWGVQLMLVPVSKGKGTDQESIIHEFGD